MKTIDNSIKFTEEQKATIEEVVSTWNRFRFFNNKEMSVDRMKQAETIRALYRKTGRNNVRIITVESPMAALKIAQRIAQTGKSKIELIDYGAMARTARALTAAIGGYTDFDSNVNLRRRLIDADEFWSGAIPPGVTYTDTGRPIQTEAPSLRVTASAEEDIKRALSALGISRFAKPVTLDSGFTRTAVAIILNILSRFDDESITFEMHEHINNVMEFTMRAGPYAAFDDVIVVSSRPSVIKLNMQEQIHCDTGPAVVWEDGVSINVINGRRLTTELTEIIR